MKVGTIEEDVNVTSTSEDSSWALVAASKAMRKKKRLEYKVTEVEIPGTLQEE